jgi:hypothetical protein
VPARTRLFEMMPWSGGVNTSTDDSLIPANQLAQADNVVIDTNTSRKKRDGFIFNFDDMSSSTNAAYGLHEFWFGSSNKVQRYISINDAREVRSYNSGGTATLLTDGGKPWQGVTDLPSMLTFNNRAILAVNGDDNLVKYWDGTSPTYLDLPNSYGTHLASSGRSSSGTTRMLVLNRPFRGLVGDFIIISNATGLNAAAYNGTYEVLTVSTTNVANDTITYQGSFALIDAPSSDANLTVDGTAPQASILREHLGRIWCNDKNNIDRIHYSGSFDHTSWLGFGDSGALDVGIGDGDPEGITAIFPTFKGEIFVAKRTKLYRVSGYSPENFSVSLVTGGIGCVSHNSIASVDQDDMLFVSEKGIHSINATSSFGDFSAAFISADIQKTFIQNFSKPRLRYCKAAYNPELNSVAFAFTDSNLPNFSLTTLDVNNSLWLYNVIQKAWYRWPDVPCSGLMVANDGDKKRFYFGSHNGRIIKSASGNNYDLSYTDQQVGIKFTVVTGQLNLDGTYYNVKGFKRFILYYKPEGTHVITVNVRIDNVPVDDVNHLVFSETPLGVLLGVDFILGVSVLGSDIRLAPYSRTIDGYGRSCKISVEQTGINQQVDIQGFGIEYEQAGTSPEVDLGTE